MSLPAPAYFLLRVTRGGPLVPARIWYCDHDPADEENKLDRGSLSVYPRADIAGAEVDPDRLFDRLWSHTDFRPALPENHWKYPEPIGESEYRFHLRWRAWAAAARPNDPRLRPRRKVEARTMALPNFDREHEILKGKPRV